MTDRTQILSDCTAMVARWDRIAFGRGPAPLPAERALVLYRQRMVYLGSRPGPVVVHLWASAGALRNSRTAEA